MRAAFSMQVEFADFEIEEESAAAAKVCMHPVSVSFHWFFSYESRVMSSNLEKKTNKKLCFHVHFEVVIQERNLGWFSLIGNGVDGKN